MIELLHHTNKEVSEKIRDVFQKSYVIEAEILKAKNFPPLKRPLEDFIKCKNEFFGYYVENILSAVVEIKSLPNYIHIQSLVVLPQYFKRGIAQKLLKFVFQHYETTTFMVETGLDNVPAINLYKKFGFKIIDQFNTDHDIVKVRLEKEI